MLHPKENNVLYCVQDVVFVFAKLQDGALRSGFSCNFAAIHLLPHPAGCKFIGSINLVGEAIGLPHYGLMDAWATTGRPYGIACTNR